MESENAVLDKVTERIRFVTEIDKLKLVLRRTKLICADRPENDAEHSWHLAIMALVFADLSNEKIDLLRVIKMLLIHDLVEIDAGDTFIYDSVKPAEDGNGLIVRLIMTQSMLLTLASFAVAYALRELVAPVFPRTLGFLAVETAITFGVMLVGGVVASMMAVWHALRTPAQLALGS